MTNKASATGARRGEQIALASILMVALVLRLWGTGFGLPDTYHWDEFTDFLNALHAAQEQGRMGNYVGASFPYLLLPIGGLSYLIARLSGLASSPFEFLVLLAENPAWLILPARAVVAAVSTATVWLAYVTCRAAIPESARAGRIGLTAATLLALASLPAQDAHYARGHTPAAFFMLLALYFVCRLAANHRPRHYVLAGLSIAFATSMEYYGAWASIMLLAGHLVSLRRQGLPLRARYLIFHRPLLLGASAAVLGFFALSPYTLFDAAFFWPWLQWYVRENAAAWVSPEGQPVWLFYLSEHLRFGAGEPLLVLAVLGAIILVGRRAPAGVPSAVLLVFPVVFLIALDRSPNHARFALPLLPFLAIWAALALDQLLAALGSRWPRYARSLPLGIAIAVMLPSALDVVRFDYWLTQPDTRSAARAWIETHVPAAATIAVEGGHLSHYRSIAGPRLQQSAARLQGMLDPADSQPQRRYLAAMLAQQKESPSYQVFNVMRLEDASSPSSYGRIDYIVTSSWAVTKSDRDPAYAHLLAEQYTLLAEFQPRPTFRYDPYTWRMDYVALRQIVPFGADYVSGPLLRVYRRHT